MKKIWYPQKTLKKSRPDHQTNPSLLHQRYCTVVSPAVFHTSHERTTESRARVHVEMVHHRQISCMDQQKSNAEISIRGGRGKKTEKNSRQSFIMLAPYYQKYPRSGLGVFITNPTICLTTVVVESMSNIAPNNITCNAAEGLIPTLHEIIARYYSWSNHHFRSIFLEFNIRLAGTACVPNQWDATREKKNSNKKTHTHSVNVAHTGKLLCYELSFPLPEAEPSRDKSQKLPVLVLVTVLKHFLHFFSGFFFTVRISTMYFTILTSLDSEAARRRPTCQPALETPDQDRSNRTPPGRRWSPASPRCERKPESIVFSKVTKKQLNSRYTHLHVVLD